VNGRWTPRDLATPPTPDCVATRNKLNKSGYGQCHVRMFGELVWLTHRAAWARHHGRLPAPGLLICHTCDWPPCVNPEHLYEGTHVDNGRDRSERNPSTECGNGHRYVPGSFYLENYRSGFVARKCIVCRIDRGAAGPYLLWKAAETGRRLEQAGGLVLAEAV
jgi:hypothetical protein